MIDYRQLIEAEWCGQNDPSHDIAHIERVLSSVRHIQSMEGGDLEILIPAVWFHDLVNLSKDHPDRKKASTLSADRAIKILKEQGTYKTGKLEFIHHAICAHSFSANIRPQTLEAKILQDADRLDALGCIGMMRTFAVSSELKRALFHPNDPFANHRDLDDSKYAIDHFEAKLFKIADRLYTDTAKYIAQERVAFMRVFQRQLLKELNPIERFSADQHQFAT